MHKRRSTDKQAHQSLRACSPGGYIKCEVLHDMMLVVFLIDTDKVGIPTGDKVEGKRSWLAYVLSASLAIALVNGGSPIIAYSRRATIA